MQAACAAAEQTPLQLQFAAVQERYPGATLRTEGGVTVVSIPNVRLPSGWNKDAATVHFIVPPAYPHASPDCFNTDADLRLASNAQPGSSCAQVMPVVGNTLWLSWHLQRPWKPGRDTLLTWLGVCLSRFEGALVIDLSFPSPELATLADSLLARTDVETCVIALTRRAGDRLVVAHQEIAPADAYLERTLLSATLKPEYLINVVNRSRAGSFGCVFAHSHPRDTNPPVFSGRDDRAEARLAELLSARLPAERHAAIVVSPGGLKARLLGSNSPVRVQEVGSKLLTVFDPPKLDGELARFDRQVRAFGYEGQRRIADLHVGVVGAGGTGSITIQQLAHLGVRKFTLIDFDAVEEANLNRLVGSGAADVGIPKLEVAKRGLLHVDTQTSVTLIAGDVADDTVARGLLGCDFIFLCTDSHASRAIVSQIAYQYLIPTIDQGVSISVRAGELAYVTGRVQLLAPGLPCLTCMELLDGEQIRREMLTPEARAADPYIIGFHEPQPSVISLNGTMASLAVSMFIGVVTAAPLDARIQIYDGRKGTVKAVAANRDGHCFVCSATGALARGDSWPLPTRPD